MEIRARYTGSGEYWNGIPARDLTSKEYEALDDDRRRLVDSGRLYEVAERPVTPAGEEA